MTLPSLGPSALHVLHLEPQDVAAGGAGLGSPHVLRAELLQEWLRMRAGRADAHCTLPDMFPKKEGHCAKARFGNHLCSRVFSRV